MLDVDAVKEIKSLKSLIGAKVDDVLVQGEGADDGHLIRFLQMDENQKCRHLILKVNDFEIVKNEIIAD